MRSSKTLAALAVVCLMPGSPAESQTVESSATPVQDSLRYADLADLALPAQIVAHVSLRNATRLDAERAIGVAPGRTRFYVEAEVVSLIRGAQGLPKRVTYLADIANDPSGKPARLRRDSQWLVLATTVPGRPGELQLVAPDAQIAFSPARADRLRAILTEAVRADAAPPITGIGRAFHVKGTLPGESETQFFLQAQGNRPVSLTVLRRPNQAPRWAVALSEIVDDAAAPPQADSLLWYRLACTLPSALPPQSFSEADPADRSAIEADYRFVKERLGACARGRAA